MDRDNKRNYFRVGILMPVTWHVLDASETDLVKKGLGCTLLTQSCFKNTVGLIPEQISSSIKNDEIYRSIQLLNNKLDYVINMMLNDFETSSTRDKIIEISASGLKFRTIKKIDTDVYLKMHLLIPGATHFQMELIAETLRVEKTDNEFLIAANIVCIDDDARDFIVKMIFQKQRIDIRRFKTNQEGDNND